MLSRQTQRWTAQSSVRAGVPSRVQNGQAPSGQLWSKRVLPRRQFSGTDSQCLASRVGKIGSSVRATISGRAP